MDHSEINSRFREYLASEIKGILFSELDDNFLFANDMAFLSGIPVPIGQEDLKSFTKDGLSTTKIADNMALVIGADGDFKYKDYYLRFLKKFFDEKLILVYVSMAERLLQSERPRKAMCYLRAALLMDPSGLQSMFSYANGCRYWYQSMEGEDQQQLIAFLKSQANEYFANVTNMYPEFAPAWYFLGYAYLNAGAYTRANIAFKHYIDNSEGQPQEDIKEVRERMEELKDPMRIEDGKNLIIAGKADEALEILIPYLETDYGKSWPLIFYVATAFEQKGYLPDAIAGYKHVLRLNPSNYDSICALADIYERLGDEENALKYSKKAEIVLSNMQNK